MESIDVSKENSYNEKIKKNLNNVLESGFIPELGKHYKGKVRDVHFTSEKVGSPIVMVASDRVSAFDHQIAEPIPYKGKVLNLFAKWAFANSKDIVENGLVDSPNDNVVIQKRFKIIPFEFIVRGFVWGSMAEYYEKGDREFCGYTLPEGLLRYQRLPEPLLTPTTKAANDENVTMQTVEKEIGKELAKKISSAALALYKRASKLADEQGYIFIDTKYEFGQDEKGNIFLVDEANTPDSSRYCTKKEYEKFAKIKAEMAKSKFKNVAELVKAKPELKISELSKQFVRDVLVESGFSYGSKGVVPHLTPEQVIETSYRYITLYENVTGEKFDFGDDSDVRQKLISSLVHDGYIKGGQVLIMAGSDSDGDHVDNIKKELDKYGIPSTVRIASAHKQGDECTKIVKEYNKSVEPLLIVAVAGGTDALSGLASFHSVWPVISCPPNKNEYQSCVTNPPGSANALILRPGNVAKFAASYFGYSNRDFHKTIEAENEAKVQSLRSADQKISGGN